MNDWLIILALIPFALVFSAFMSKGRPSPKPKKVTFYL